MALAGMAPGGEGILHNVEIKMVFLGAALALVLITSGAVLAGKYEAEKSEFVPNTLDLGLQPPLDRYDLLAQNPTATTDTPPQPSSTEPPAKPKKPLRFEETKAGKSYLLPAGEIVGFNILSMK